MSNIDFAAKLSRLCTMGMLTATLLGAQPFAAEAAGAKASSPQELHQALATAFNSGNVEAVIALYEDGGALVPQPGQIVTGKKDIREALKGFLAIEGDMRIETTWSVQSGDIALTRSLWSIRAGDEVKIQKAGNEIMRRQADGTWLFVVDHPFGSEAAQ